jgi:hypothetical protein
MAAPLVSAGSSPARYPAELLRFARWHWIHLLLAPLLGLTMVTFLHECAHAAVVLAQGGELLDFSFLPSARGFGYVSYNFPPGADYSAAAISLAPYVMWSGLAATALLVALLWRSISFWAASTLFCWFFAVPLGDCAMACAGYLLGADNDLFHALGPPDEVIALVLMLLGLYVFLLGFGLQRLLYRERALSPLGYATLASACVLVIGAVGVIRI